jgi:hypothetical protein
MGSIRQHDLSILTEVSLVYNLVTGASVVEIAPASLELNPCWEIFLGTVGFLTHVS